MPQTAPNGYPSTFARFEHALALRREGKTYQQIGDRLGIKPEKAQKIVSHAIRRILKDTAEDVRQMELSRLELLIKTIWDDAITDAQAKVPDFRRLDRLKGLIESKLRYCGAQPVVENFNDNRVQITVRQLTAPAAPEIRQITEIPTTAEVLEEVMDSMQ